MFTSIYLFTKIYQSTMVRYVFMFVYIYAYLFIFIYFYMHLVIFTCYCLFIYQHKYLHWFIMFYLYCFTIMYTGLLIFGAYICIYIICVVCSFVFISLMFIWMYVFLLMYSFYMMIIVCFPGVHLHELGALADCQVSAWSPGQLEPKSGRGTSGDGKFAPNSWAFHGILHGDSPIESFRRCFLFIFVPHEDAFFFGPRMMWPYVHKKHQKNLIMPVQPGCFGPANGKRAVINGKRRLWECLGQIYDNVI